MNAFDQLADGYEAWYSTPLGAFVVAREQAALVDAISRSPTGRLLEIGAGTGWWSRRLAMRGHEVTALEPSAPMRRVGAQNCRDTSVNWVPGVAEQLPFNEHEFDVAVLMTVLEFVADPARALDEAWRVIRPGGALIVGYLEATSPWVALYRRLADRGVDPWPTARFATADDVEAWCERGADDRWASAWLAPDARPPFEEADHAGRRAGNAPALTVLRWTRKP